MTDKKYKQACASTLFHDIGICCNILAFHSLNNFNEYSVHFHERLFSLSQDLINFRKELDEYISHV